MDTINSYLQSNGLSITSTGGYNEVGTTGAHASLPSDKGSDISDIFGSFKFGSSSDSVLNNYLQNNSFGSLTDLQTAVTNYETLVNSTIPSLEAWNTQTGSLSQQIAAIDAQFQPAIASAQQYGVATGALTDAYNAATAAANAAAQSQVDQLNSTMQGNYLTAAATISGNPADAETAALFNFDAQAAQQKTQLQQQLEAIYGTSYDSTSAYADETAQLEKTLGEQRLAIQTQYNDQITQTAESAVQSLQQYALSLETGSSSPLSAQDQYSLAEQNFKTDAAGAESGDYTSIQNFQSDANALLSTSQAVNGSGAAYQADFQSILDALQGVSQVSPDALTASVLTATTQSQTNSLMGGFTTLQQELVAIKNAINANTAMPARLAS